MSFKEWALAEAIIKVLKSGNVEEGVARIADRLDELADERLGGRSENVQLQVVGRILLPLAKELTRDSKESRTAYRDLLALAFKDTIDGLRRDFPDEGEEK